MTFAIDWIWWLLALPIAFGLGWLFSRLDVWHWKVESRHQPRAYFKGLNHLLNGQQDDAVDSFIEAVQNDPDTSELHFTLGNLFRRRGEYDRAVRVHEHLLARADLSAPDRERAQMALAQDYSKAGLLDRAEAAIKGTSLGLAPLQSQDAQQLLLTIFERGRDWASAEQLAAQMEAKGAGSMDRRRAHYLCEQQLFDAAIALSPSSPRAYIEQARKHFDAGDFATSHQLLVLAASQSPQALSLLASQLWASSKTNQQQQATVRILAKAYDDTYSLSVLETLMQTGAAGWTDAPAAYAAHLIKEPSLIAASYLIESPETKAALKKATEPLKRYRCAACGFEAKQYFWQCPGCQAWDSYPFKRVEEL
jgi:lipopolysaccharide biosynthesis regulator YciM